MAAEPFDLLPESIDPAMVVVTAAANRGGEVSRSGCLVGFHAQSSIEPLRYSVWLSKANHTYTIALASDHLAVHFLTQDDLDLAELFGTRTGDDVDKFAECAWTPGPGAVPLLDACGNRLVIERTVVLDEGGDHVCVVGQVVDAASTGRFQPLRLSDVSHLDPGHDAEERREP